MESRSHLRNSWPKFLRVHNRAIAQSALLYPVIHLVEVALRARVDSTLERLHGRGWYTEPALYLDGLTLKRLLGSHDMATVVRTDAAGARVVGPQKSAAAFLSRLPLWAVQRIVEHGLRTGTLRDAFAPRADGKRVDGLWVSESLTIIRDARNAVAHHRPLVESHFDNAYSRCIQLLELLEFDLGRTNARLEAAVHTFRHDRNLMPVVGIRGSSAPHG